MLRARIRMLACPCKGTQHRRVRAVLDWTGPAATEEPRRPTSHTTISTISTISGTLPCPALTRPGPRAAQLLCTVYTVPVCVEQQRRRRRVHAAVQSAGRPSRARHTDRHSLTCPCPLPPFHSARPNYATLQPPRRTALCTRCLLATAPGRALPGAPAPSLPTLPACVTELVVVWPACTTLVPAAMVQS